MPRTAAALLMLSLSAAAFAQQPAPPTDIPLPPFFKAGNGMTAPKQINTIDPYISAGNPGYRHDAACAVVLVVDVNGLPQDVKIVRCTDSHYAEESIKSVQLDRYDPARTADGKATAVRISNLMVYHLDGDPSSQDNVNYCASTDPPISFVHFGLRASSGLGATQPDSSGAYPLTRDIAPPQLKKLATVDLCEQGFSMPEPLVCDIPLTISDKGKAHPDEKVHCSDNTAETAAAKSLNGATFQPAVYQGKPVAVKLIFHLIYGEPAQPSPAPKP